MLKKCFSGAILLILLNFVHANANIIYSENLAIQGTITASSYYGSRLPAHVIDGNIDQSDAGGWTSNGETETGQPWIKCDFGSGNEKIIQKMSFIPYYNGNGIKDWIFEASNDNTNWAIITNGSEPHEFTEKSYEFNNNIAYRYYRLRTTSWHFTSYWMGLVDWKMYAETTNVVQCPIDQYTENLANQGTITASSYYGSRLPAHVIDGNIDQNDAGGWTSNGETETGQPWIKCDFGSGNEKIIRKMSFIPYYNGNGIKDWIFEASNDNTNWAIITNGSEPHEFTEKTYEFCNDTAYRYYRFRTTSWHYGNYWMGLVDWKMYAEAIDVVQCPVNQYTGNLAAQVTTFYGGTESGDYWIECDFGTNNEQIIRKMSFIPYYIGDGFENLDWIFEASNDNVNWHIIIKGSEPNRITEKTSEFCNDTAYRYYRLRRTSWPTCSYCFVEFVDLKLYAEATTNQYTVNLAVQGTITASSYYGSRLPAHVIDGNIDQSDAGGWTSNGETETGQPWIKCDFGSGNEKIIQKMSFIPYYNGNGIKDWIFEASNDNTNWAIITNGSEPHEFTEKSYEFNNNIAYRYYRLRTTSWHFTSYWMGLVDWKMYAEL